MILIKSLKKTDLLITHFCNYTYKKIRKLISQLIRPAHYSSGVTQTIVQLKKG